jgi:predicted outer membrane repeat protein
VGGGAIVIFTDTTVSASTFTGNGTDDSGGAIYMQDDPTATVNLNTFSHNYAPDSGALFNESGTMNVTGGQFGQNTAYSRGGGIYKTPSSYVTLTNSQVEYNHAPTNEGGGIYKNNGTVTLDNSTVKWNIVNNCTPRSSAASRRLHQTTSARPGLVPQARAGTFARGSLPSHQNRPTRPLPGAPHGARTHDLDFGGVIGPPIS